MTNDVNLTPATEVKTAIGAVVVPDPTLKPQDGDVLKFQVVNVPMLKFEGNAVYTELHAFSGVLLAIHFADKESHDVDGSAVMVAPGVALSAKHVIEPHLDRIFSDGRFSICTGISDNELHIWTVRKVTFIEGTDIAILGLERNSALPSDHTFRQVGITTRLPKIGERVQIVGFRREETTQTKVGERDKRTTGGLTILSAGVVTNRYPQRRDSFNLPWPVIEVDCPTWGGMSGGPVFDEQGLLVGLLCSSILHGEREDEGTSYASLLWPVLGMRYEGGWPTAAFPGETSLIELDPCICQIDRRDAVACTHDSQTGRTTTTYTAWE